MFVLALSSFSDRRGFIKSVIKKGINSLLEHHEKLQIIVDELLKEHPKEKVIQSCLKKGGFNLSNDPIERIGSIIKTLDLSTQVKKNHKSRVRF